MSLSQSAICLFIYVPISRWTIPLKQSVADTLKRQRRILQHGSLVLFVFQFHYPFKTVLLQRIERGGGQPVARPPSCIHRCSQASQGQVLIYGVFYILNARSDPVHFRLDPDPSLYRGDRHRKLLFPPLHPPLK
jgi:hypothetical protein